MKKQSTKTILANHLASLIGCDAAALALPIKRLARYSAQIWRLNEKECSEPMTENEQIAHNHAYTLIIGKARKSLAAISDKLIIEELNDPRAGAGFALLWKGPGRLPGNSFGGDESGFRL